MIISRDFVFFTLMVASAFVLNPLFFLLSFFVFILMFGNGLRKPEIGVSILFFGVSVLGYIGLKLGIGPLGKISGLLGIYLVKESIPSLKEHIKLVFTLLVSFFICVVFYFTGPMTAVSLDKLSDVIYYSVVYMVLFNAVFFYGKTICYVKLARVSLLFIFAYLTFAAQYDLNSYKSFVPSFSGLRTAVDQWSVENILYTKDGFGDTVSAVSYQLVGNYSALSLILLLTYILCSDSPYKLISKFKFIIILHILLILISGARQSIVLVLLSTASLFLCGGNVNRVFLAKFSVVLFSSIVGFVILGLMLEIRAIVFLFEAEGGLASVINRKINVDAAYELIREKPWLGHGFGGYYIPEFGFKPGEFRYFPHNVVLELLSELGVIGTVLFLGTWLFHYFSCYVKSKVNILKAEVFCGYFALPIVVFYLTSALMNEILVKSIAFFILVSFMLNRRKERV